MKYLKVFKLWESNNQNCAIPTYIQQELLDRSLDLKDEGYKVTFQFLPQSDNHPYINITKPGEGPQIDWRSLDKIWYMSINDFCQEVGSYLDSEGYNITIKYLDEKTGKYLNVKDTITDWGPFSNYPMCHSIHYKIKMIDRDIWGDTTE